MIFLTLFFAAQSALCADAPKAPVVLVSPAKKSELFDVLTYPARVIPRVNANVLSESDGVVAKIFAPLGTKVRRGQKLMVIRHTDPIYQYAPLTIVAPVAGVVSGVDISEGTLVSKGQKLASITDPSQVRVNVEIAAADLSAIHAGLTGELTISGRGEPVPVAVRGVSPFVDPGTGTATCELEAKGLAPGLVGQAKFKVNRREGYSLPDHAIVHRGSDAFVRLVENGKAKYVKVAIGRKQRGMVEIATGLSDGAKIIERANGFVADGEQVQVQETKL